MHCTDVPAFWHAGFVAMATSEADAYLIDAVQGGDQDAWREVIERYQGRLVSFAFVKEGLSSESGADVCRGVHIWPSQAGPNTAFTIALPAQRHHRASGRRSL